MSASNFINVPMKAWPIPEEPPVMTAQRYPESVSIKSFISVFPISFSAEEKPPLPTKGKSNT
jgi:hypothetical protein